MATGQITARVNDLLQPVMASCIVGGSVGAGTIAAINLTELQTALTAFQALVTAAITQANTAP